MRIAHIVPGSGGTFYCQNCLRDLALAQAQRAAGHETLIVPLYLPLSEQPAQIAPVFFGAVNVYLEQTCALFRHTPRWLDRWLDAPSLLGLIARKATSTRARGMEGLTLSMLRGEQGRQAKELHRLLDWLQTQWRPEVVHLSNALLLGLAPELKRRLNVPVVCSLQDEDVWIEAMEADAAADIYHMAARQAQSVDRFISVSRYYADYLQPKLELREEQIAVIPPGLPLEGYERSPLPESPPVLGFLSRLTQSLGLDILVEAYLALRKTEALREMRLHLCGGLTGDDRAFVDGLLERLKREGCAELVQIFPCGSREDRQMFLRTLTVLSVPAPRGEAIGMFILEANASGVPVVQPEAGGFGETVRTTGGGVLYRPDPTAPALALEQALRELLLNPQRLQDLAAAGRAGVERDFELSHIEHKTASLYRALLPTGGSASAQQCEATTPAAEATTMTVRQPLVEVREVVKGFNAAAGEMPVLRGVNLRVDAGETVAICGPSGSGKSTLLNLIGALDVPDAGEVFISGQTLRGVNDTALAHLRNRTIGFVFQLHHLLPQLTALENVLLPALAEELGASRAVRERAQELLRRVGLAHRERHLPAVLSGGERQRVAVARALINRPRLLLADEPTGALDAAAARGLIDLLLELNRTEGVALLLVTHDDTVAGRMHRQLRMQDGRLA